MNECTKQTSRHLAWVLLAAAACAGPAIPALGQEPGATGPPPTPVRAETVRREVLQERRLVTGDLHALRRSRVAARGAGLVLARHVVEGQAVRRGEVLAELDPALLEVELRRIEADGAVIVSLGEERSAELEQRQADLESLRESYERGAATSKELRDAEADVRVAKARLDQTVRQGNVNTSRAEMLRIRLADMKIRAPFDGVVIGVEADLGEWVGEGETVLEIVSSGAIEAWLNVPQRLRAAVAAGTAPVAVSLEAREGMIEVSERRLIPQVDPKARTFTVVVRLPNEDGMLAPGMSVTGFVPTFEAAPHLTVPKNALLRNETGFYVYVIRGAPGAGRAAPVPVQALFPVGDRMAVRAEGLAEGDQVVVEGNERLFPMMPVMPVGDEVPVATDGAENAG